MNSRVLPFLALAAAVGIFFTYINPTWTGQISALKAAIVADDEALAAAAKYEEQINKLASEKSAISEENMSRLIAFLPDSVNNVQLILDLNALAAKSGLALSGIDVKKSENSATADAAPARGPASVGSATMSLSAVGTFAALQTFLKGVERSGRLLDVRDINISGSDTGVYTYQMTILLYWLR